MPLKDISVNEQLYLKIKEIAHKKGISIRQFVEPILEAAVKGDYADEKQVSDWKKIAVRYPTRCIYCGKEVRPGETAMWAKGVGVAHLSCWLERQVDLSGDKALAKKYLKIKELEATIRGLKAEADALADVVLEKKAIAELKDLGERIRSLAERLYFVIVNYGVNVNQETIEELVAMAEEIDKGLKRILMKLDTVKKREPVRVKAWVHE